MIEIRCLFIIKGFEDVDNISTSLEIKLSKFCYYIDMEHYWSGVSMKVIMAQFINIFTTGYFFITEYLILINETKYIAYLESVIYCIDFLKLRI